MYIDSFVRDFHSSLERTIFSRLRILTKPACSVITSARFIDRKIRMTVGNVCAHGATRTISLSFGPGRAAPRLAETGRTRTNSWLESRRRDASVRTRAPAGCLACLPSASFEAPSSLVSPLSCRRESRRRARVLRFSKIRALPAIARWSPDAARARVSLPQWRAGATDEPASTLNTTR